ncbi:MAG TPA: TonB-dependent receptor [Pseudolabrys sp.]|nr:TonB-dependent receptor [Pseudolabrys sp.]
MGTKLPAVGALALTCMLAQAAAAQDKEITLPQIVVSPTTIPTSADQVASSVTVITGRDLERDHISTVPDALRTVPGLNVVQTGGPGGQTAVFMRGTNSNHVKVLIDGVDVSDPVTPNGAFDFAHLLTGDVERIEVLRGPQSGLYGSDAIGGVISITTKKGEGPPKVTASLEGGSFGTFNQTAGLSGSQGGFNYAFNVLHFRSTTNWVTPPQLLAPGEKRNPDSYDNRTYSARLGADVTDNLALNVVGRYTDAHKLFTGDNFVAFPAIPEAMRDTQVNHNSFVRGEAVWTLFDGKFRNVLGTSYTNQWNWNMDPNPDSFTPFGSVAAPTKNIGEKTKYDWRGELKVLPGETLVLGLEKENQKLRTDSTLTAIGTPFLTTEHKADKAGWVELQSEFYERVFVVSNVRYDDDESFGPHRTWRVAPAFIVPVTDTKLKASYGTGFKAPTLTELFVNNPAIGQVANPALKPEISRGYDYGFEQPLFDNKLRFGVTYYRNRITDLITTQFNPSTFTFSYMNIGQAETHGYEAFASARLSAEVSVRADYTYTATRDLSTDLGLLRRPAHKSSLTTIWTPLEGLTLSGTVLHVSSWVDVNRDTAVFIPRLDAKPYTTVNLAANYNVNERVTMFAHADNLFNYQYQNPFGFERPGLGVFAGVRVTN